MNMTHGDILKTEVFGLPKADPGPTAFCAACTEEVPEDELRYFPCRVEKGRVKEERVCKHCRAEIRKDDPAFARMKHNDPFNCLTKFIRELEGK